MIDPADHIGLAYAAADKYGHANEREENASIAMVEIVKAAKAYDPSIGAFSTFAMKYAKRGIWSAHNHNIRACRDKRRTVRLTDDVNRWLATYDPKPGVEQDEARYDAAQTLAAALAILPPSAAKTLLESVNSKVDYWSDDAKRNKASRRKLRELFTDRQALERFADMHNAPNNTKNAISAYSRSEAAMNAIEDEIVLRLNRDGFQTPDELAEAMPPMVSPVDPARVVALSVREVANVCNALYLRSVLVRSGEAYWVKGGRIQS